MHNSSSAYGKGSDTETSHFIGFGAIAITKPYEFIGSLHLRRPLSGRPGPGPGLGFGRVWVLKAGPQYPGRRYGNLDPVVGRFTSPWLYFGKEF